MHISSVLSTKTCVPCEGGASPLEREQVTDLLTQVKGWKNDEAYRLIYKEFEFSDFAEALAFVNTVGSIVEEQGHHPDIFLHGWNKVRISLSTHAIGGLSKNDFIIAARIDKVV